MSTRASCSPSSGFLYIAPSPYHDDVLVDALAEAFVEVWETLGLPLNQRAIAAE